MWLGFVDSKNSSESSRIFLLLFSFSLPQVKPSDVVDLLASVLDSPYTTDHIRQYVLTSLAKLDVRITSSVEQSRVEKLLSRYDSSVEVEIQQRAVEFGALLNRKDIREAVLESMPPPEIKQTVLGTRSESKPVGSTRTDKDSLLDLMGDEMPSSSSGNNLNGNNGNGASTQQSTQDLLADIFGGDGGMGASSSNVTSPTSSQPAQKSTNDIMDLFGSSSSNSAAGGSGMGMAGLGGMSSQNPPPTNGSGLDSLNSGLQGLDIFGGGSGSSSTSTPAPTQAQVSTPAAPVASTSPQSYTAYDQKGLKISLSPAISPARPDVVNITARFECTGMDSVQGVNFQAAVPKVSIPS